MCRLKTKWQIDSDRLILRIGTEPQRPATLKLTIKPPTTPLTPIQN